ncbi:MAG: DUF1489 family protein [Janthinobacterium lividum]
MLRDGLPHCGLVYEPELVPVQPQPHCPFQGWRYLNPKDAPMDRTIQDNVEKLTRVRPYG